MERSDLPAFALARVDQVLSPQCVGISCQQAILYMRVRGVTLIRDFMPINNQSMVGPSISICSMHWNMTVLYQYRSSHVILNIFCNHVTQNLVACVKPQIISVLFEGANYMSHI